MTQIEANAKNIDDALKQGDEHNTYYCASPKCSVTIGLAASSSSSSSSNASGTKRPSTVESSVKPKKLHLW